MKQFFHSLFYLPKHEKLTDRSFMKIVISSIAGIVLCCLCLSSLTWAWFEDGAVSNSNAIASASFWADVYIEKVDTSTINDGESDEYQEEPENDGGEAFVIRSGSPYLLTSVPVLVIEDSSLQFPLAFKLAGSYRLENLETGEYKITVHPRGTAKKVGGYIAVKADGMDTLYTEPLMVDEEFVFTFFADTAAGGYEFCCMWGSLPYGIDENNILKNELGEETPDNPSSDTNSEVNSDDETASSVENDAVSSEEPTDSSAQENTEEIYTEENSSEI